MYSLLNNEHTIIPIVPKLGKFPNNMLTRRIPVKAINYHMHVVTLPYHLHNSAHLRGIVDNQQVVS